MIPPVDDHVLRNNPRFEKLYNTITASILNPDGSTKIDPSAKQRDAVCQELKAYRLKAARVHLLGAAISTAIPSQTPQPAKQQQDEEPKQKQYQHNRRAKSRPQPPPQTQPSSLPPDLVELLILIPPFLNNASTLPPSFVTLLLTSPPFTSLPTLFPQLLGIVSTRLTLQAKALARVISPSTNPSYIHRIIPSLPAIANALVSDLAASKTQLSRARLAATATLTRHLQQHTEALALLLGALEAKHGPVATSSELRAADARHGAREWALAAEALLWDTRRRTYPPEARAALAHYLQHLGDAGRRLEDGARVREAELADYGVDVDRLTHQHDNNSNDDRGHDGVGGNSRPRRTRGRRGTASVDENKERTMREIARVWREMETRLGEIQGDLHRLR